MFAFYRYFGLRNCLSDVDVNNFFVTNCRQKVTKLYDDVNNTCGINISSSLFRKIIKTQGIISQDQKVAYNMALALCHSDTTATTHYRIAYADTALRRHATISRVDDTAIVNNNVKAK